MDFFGCDFARRAGGFDPDQERARTGGDANRAGDPTTTRASSAAGDWGCAAVCANSKSKALYACSIKRHRRLISTRRFLVEPVCRQANRAENRAEKQTQLPAAQVVRNSRVRNLRAAAVANSHKILQSKPNLNLLIHIIQVKQIGPGPTTTLDADSRIGIRFSMPFRGYAG